MNSLYKTKDNSGTGGVCAPNMAMAQKTQAQPVMEEVELINNQVDYLNAVIDTLKSRIQLVLTELPEKAVAGQTTSPLPYHYPLQQSLCGSRYKLATAIERLQDISNCVRI